MKRALEPAEKSALFLSANGTGDAERQPAGRLVKSDPAPLYRLSGPAGKPTTGGESTWARQARVVSWPALAERGPR